MVPYKFAVFLIIVLAEVNGQEVKYPVEIGVSVGDSATLHCAYTEKGCLKIKWQKRLESGSVEDISDGGKVYDDKKYRLDISSACDLVIEDVQPSDFGIFICNISGSTSGSAAILFELPKMGQSKTKSKAHNKPPSHKYPKSHSSSKAASGLGSALRSGHGSASKSGNPESQDDSADSEPDNPESEFSSESESSSGPGSGFGLKPGVIVGIVIGVVVLVVIVGIIIYFANN